MTVCITGLCNLDRAIFLQQQQQPTKLVFFAMEPKIERWRRKSCNEQRVICQTINSKLSRGENREKAKLNTFFSATHEFSYSEV